VHAVGGPARIVRVIVKHPLFGFGCVVCAAQVKRVGGRLVLVIEGCEQDVDTKDSTVFGTRRVFGVGGLDLSNVVTAATRNERVVTADLFDESGNVRGPSCSVALMQRGHCSVAVPA
jgi:hypothetical protein